MYWADINRFHTEWSKQYKCGFYFFIFLKRKNRFSMRRLLYLKSVISLLYICNRFTTQLLLRLTRLAPLWTGIPLLFALSLAPPFDNETKLWLIYCRIITDANLCAHLTAKCIGQWLLKSVWSLSPYSVWLFVCCIWYSVDNSIS